MFEESLLMQCPRNQKDQRQPTLGQTIGYINKLFKIEQALENELADKRKKERLKQEKPKLEAFWLWAEKIASTVLTKAKLSEAFEYEFNHKDGLMTSTQNVVIA